MKANTLFVGLKVTQKRRLSKGFPGKSSVFFFAEVYLGDEQHRTQNTVRLVGFKVGKKIFWVATNRNVARRFLVWRRFPLLFFGREHQYRCRHWRAGKAPSAQNLRRRLLLSPGFAYASFAVMSSS
jgi:hypothetical protein